MFNKIKKKLLFAVQAGWETRGHYYTFSEYKNIKQLKMNQIRERNL